MKRYLILPMLAVVGFTMFLTFIAATSAFAQDRPYSEEHMQLHDGGDRAEYLQEMEHSDPWFYVPPVNDASISSSTPSPTTNNTVPAN
jgi:hypothetical protein